MVYLWWLCIWRGRPLCWWYVWCKRSTVEFGQLQNHLEFKSSISLPYTITLNILCLTICYFILFTWLKFSWFVVSIFFIKSRYRDYILTLMWRDHWQWYFVVNASMVQITDHNHFLSLGAIFFRELFDWGLPFAFPPEHRRTSNHLLSNGSTTTLVMLQWT